MVLDEDSVDWSKYPPDRVEGLKFFYCRNPSSAEDGPCTEDELKMLCTKWKCKVDMRADNFLYWLIKKTKEKTLSGDEERFQRKWPIIVDSLRRRGVERYNKYQIRYGEENRAYFQRHAEFRRDELRRIRYWEKLSALAANWSWSDSDDDEEDDDDDECSDLVQNDPSDSDIFANSTANTIVHTRFNDYTETESGILLNVENEVEISGDENNAESEDITTQTFLPRIVSTQKLS